MLKGVVQGQSRQALMSWRALGSRRARPDQSRGPSAMRPVLMSRSKGGATRGWGISKTRPRRRGVATYLLLWYRPNNVHLARGLRPPPHTPHLGAAQEPLGAPGSLATARLAHQASQQGWLGGPGHVGGSLRGRGFRGACGRLHSDYCEFCFGCRVSSLVSKTGRPPLPCTHGSSEM